MPNRLKFYWSQFLSAVISSLSHNVNHESLSGDQISQKLFFCRAKVFRVSFYFCLEQFAQVCGYYFGCNWRFVNWTPHFVTNLIFFVIIPETLSYFMIEACFETWKICRVEIDILSAIKKQLKYLYLIAL